MSRALWIDEGNDADYAKLRRYGIGSPYFAVRDPRVTKDYLRAVRAAGFAPGIYAAWNWPGVGTTGQAFAEWLSAKCRPLFANTAPDFPKVCVDIEIHSPAYIVSFFRRWRELRPQRVTDWTLEGHQGGTFTPSLVDAVATVGVCPQLYDGDMTQVWDSLAMARDLTAAGIDEAAVKPFYDAAHLPEWWEGFAFTQGRLP